MKKTHQILTIALAYLGTVVGAGFASGKEIEQYYVAFGINGFWGTLLSTLVYALTGYVALQLGSYYRALDHHDVLKNISAPWLSKTLDVISTLTLFALGFTMIAGGGSNLQQQFNISPWIGSLVIAIAILVAGYFDIDRVTQIIGYLTPFIVVFFLVTPFYSFFSSDLTLSQADQIAQQLPQALPHWTISAFNHVSLNFMLVFSMATVMGGNEEDIQVASLGGGLGGAWIGLLQLLGYLAIFLKVDIAGGTAMPLLALANDIHPLFGFLMSITIYVMILSTGIAMFFPLAQRLYNVFYGSRAFYDRKHFALILIFSVLAGFIFSFAGFESLVAYVYPLIGYSGFLLMFILIFAWLKRRSDISREQQNR